MEKLYTILVFLLLNCCVFKQGLAQHKMGNNPTTIDNGSLLELESTNKALVPPRMTTSQMNTIPTPLVGAVVYNTTENCLHQYRRINQMNRWVSLCQGNEMITISLENNFIGNIGAPGATTTLNGIEKVNTLDGASFNNSTNMITLPPGTYSMTLVYEGHLNGLGSGWPIVSSYFFDFPGARIHNNQAHNAGGTSNHGGSMSYVVTLYSTATLAFHIGRGQGGNWSSTSALNRNSTFFSAIRILK